MRSVKLSLPGAYWDSQIYSGELILFDWNNAIQRIDWRDVVDQLAEENPHVQTALRVAFSDSDLFYNPKVRKILFDPAITSPIKSQLNLLAELDIDFNRRKISSQKHDSPFDFLSTDTEIYYGQIFACGDEGLFSSPRSNVGTTKSKPLRAVQCHDASFQQIRASDRHTAIAAAGGEDGLFEFNFNKDLEGNLTAGKILAKRKCTACEWSFQSVMGWTANSAFLASFREERDNKTKKIFRSFDRIVESSEIFGPRSNGSEDFMWGSREKIYRLSPHGIEVTNYTPPKINGMRKKEAPLNHKFDRAQSETSIPSGHEMPIATATAPFGTILEYPDHIMVLRSDGQTDHFPGEAVHWRVFPRSDLYSNQLHIIYEGHMVIVSFVHDYFVNQTQKLFGFSRASTTTEKHDPETANLW